MDLAALVDALRVEVEGLEVASLSPVEAREALSLYASAEKLCAAATLRLASVAISPGAAAGRELADATGVSVGVAKQILSASETATRVPELAQVLASGEFSSEQGLALAQAAAADPEVLPDLVETARHRSLEALRDESRKVVLGAHDRHDLFTRQRNARRVRHGRNEFGMVTLTAELEPVPGTMLVTRLERETKRLYRAARRGRTPLTWEQARADALLAILGAGSDAATGASGPGTAKGRSDLTVVIDLATLRAGLAGGGRSRNGSGTKASVASTSRNPHPHGVCHVPGVGPVPVETATAMLDDAFVKAVIHDGVEIRTVCHLGRRMPAELRSALELGTVPGFDGAACANCGSRHHLEWDHLDPVANGGVTSYDNLEAKCWPCHEEKTRDDRRRGLLGPDPPTGRSP